MMYSRLYLAKNLLMPEGNIFISIGDNEAANLLKICDEVFGEENCVGVVTWKARVKPVNIGEAKFRPQKEVEYVCIYQKDFCEGVFQPLLTGGQRYLPSCTGRQKISTRHNSEIESWDELPLDNGLRSRWLHAP